MIYSSVWVRQEVSENFVEQYELPHILYDKCGLYICQIFVSLPVKYAEV